MPGMRLQQHPPCSSSSFSSCSSSIVAPRCTKALDGNDNVSPDREDEQPTLTLRALGRMIESTDIEVVRAVVAEAKKCGVLPALQDPGRLATFEKICERALDGKVLGPGAYKDAIVAAFGDHSPPDDAPRERKPPGPDIKALLNRTLGYYHDRDMLALEKRVPSSIPKLGEITLNRARRLEAIASPAHCAFALSRAGRWVSSSFPSSSSTDDGENCLRTPDLPGKDARYDELCEVVHRLVLLLEAVVSLFDWQQGVDRVPSHASVALHGLSSTAELLERGRELCSTVISLSLCYSSKPTPAHRGANNSRPLLRGDGLAFPDSLWEVLQPELVRAAMRHGILRHQQPPLLLYPFLRATAVSSRGNQRGSKHGATIQHANGSVVAEGWNHCMMIREGIRMSSRKVIHAEVHCLLSLESQLFHASNISGRTPAELKASVRTSLRNSTLWIVEPGKEGALYHWAHPCPACTMALTNMGVTKIRYSSPAGVRGESLVLNPNPKLLAPPYELARLEMKNRRWLRLGEQH